MVGIQHHPPPWPELQALRGEGLSYRELGLHYNVSGTTVQRWVAHYEAQNHAVAEPAGNGAGERVLARCRACRWAAEQRVFHPDWIFYVRPMRLIIFDLEQAHENGLAPLRGTGKVADDGSNS